MPCLAACIALSTAHLARADELPNSVPSVMDYRWAAANAYGVSELQPETGGDWKPKIFAELALRYRLFPMLEVGASGGGSLTRTSGVLMFAADVRARLYAERAWNPFVFAGVGAATFSSRDDWHLGLRGGVGLERRFEQWGFSVDAQVLRVGADPGAKYGEARDGALTVSVSMAAVYYWGHGRRHHNRFVP